MGRRSIFIWTGVCFFLSAAAQTSYLNKPDLMGMAEKCIIGTYNFSFEQASQIQTELKERTPDHPAPFFLEALIFYWRSFPLTPDKDASIHFIELMDKSIHLAEEMMEDKSTYLEGVFFDLFGRAFKAMYWADNGKPVKVIPDLRTMYSHTMEGFTLKEELNEFYFSTGLYNYYIEAYPEAHPVYKPLVSFMQDGNRSLGLVQLNYSIEHSIYLRVEAMLFMTLIQLNYENDLKTAALYAERLHREYPGNIYYQGLLISILLHQHRYRMVDKVLELIATQEDVYSEMIRQFARAFGLEKNSDNDEEAGKRYLRTIELADSIGPFADTFKAMAYMGLSRLYDQKGLYSESRRYAWKASRYTVYSFILDEK